MAERFLGGLVPAPGDPATDGDRALRQVAEGLGARIAEAMEGFAFHRALEAIWELLGAGNRYIDEQRPWELARRDRPAVGRVLGHLCEALRLVGLFVSPFLPSTADRIWRQLGIAAPVTEAGLAVEGRWGAGPGPHAVAKGDSLFPRVELSLEEAPAAPAPAAPAAGPTGDVPEASLEEFRRLDLRVAKVLEARAVPNSKKLVQLTIDTGTDQRTIVAGILIEYPPAELVGKHIVVVANLKPSKLMGVESRGMLLAATDSDGRVVLVTPERPAAPGSRVK
jgi:methionyl-tRNA synthetase